MIRGLPWQRHPEAIWALKDVNLEIRQGDVLGIIGPNGAGKSTLLKILSRITEPTCGRVELRGRVGSLLEVGTGFHPELTGRENIYLNGAILGMRRAEIDRRFDEIVGFAEIERFLDTPVKRYSSGMFVRLAFAVAAHLEPEILLVDEVLAVGDVSFQRKCLGKMGDVANDGRTVLFVSHQIPAIATIAEEVVVLEGGMVSFRGETSRGVDRYLSSFKAAAPKAQDLRSDDGSIVLSSFDIIGVDGKRIDTVTNDSEIQIRIHFGLSIPIPGLAVGFAVSLLSGEVVFSSFHTDSGIGASPCCSAPGDYQICATIPRRFLNERTYNIGPVIQIPGKRMFIDLPRLARIRVIRTTQKAGCAVRPGCVLPYLKWTMLDCRADPDRTSWNG